MKLLFAHLVISRPQQPLRGAEQSAKSNSCKPASLLADKFVFLALILIILTGLFQKGFCQSQRSKVCGVDASYLEKTRERDARLEKWISSHSKSYQKTRASATSDDNRVITLPIIVHIIDSGDAMGDSEMISNQRVLNQIEILNMDFRRNNPDRNTTDSSFLPVAADVRIEFKLVRSDPEGAPTSGINRIRGPDRSDSYEISELKQLNELIEWPPSHYINVYVADLTVLGFSSFPFSSLPGISVHEINHFLDNATGVYIDAKHFGIKKPVSLGRTLTHEMGHYLGLKHLWDQLDDQRCSDADFCSDTPSQSLSYANICGINEDLRSCGSRDMVGNYMNYTNDACMNLFTECQKLRMRTVILHSPNRTDLPFSKGFVQPRSAGIDLSIIGWASDLLKPDDYVIPTLLVSNKGSSVIESFRISILKFDRTLDEKEFIRTLQPAQEALVHFPLQLIPENADSPALLFTVLEVNGGHDQNTTNDVFEITLDRRSEPRTLPTEFTFDDDLSGTRALRPESPDEPSSWTFERTDAQRGGYAVINYCDNDTPLGEKDVLMTPQLDVRGIRGLRFSFEFAYGGTENEFGKDGLEVHVLGNSGYHTIKQIKIFSRFGNRLQTTPVIQQSLPVRNDSSWDSFSMEIPADFYSSESYIQIHFVGYFGQGNTLFLDNIRLSRTQSSVDLALVNFSPPAVTCGPEILFPFEVRNDGREPISGFEAILLGRGADSYHETSSFTTPPLASGESLSIVFPGVSPKPGDYLWTLQVNTGRTEESTVVDNNWLTHISSISNAREALPYAQNFDVPPASWIIQNPQNSSIWAHENRSGDGMMKASGFRSRTLPGKTGTIYSPLLTAQEPQLNLYFEYSYLKRYGLLDRFQVKLHPGCDVSRSYPLLSRDSEALSEKYTMEENQPDDSKESWQSVWIFLDDYLYLSPFRISFSFEDQGGNNLFLDNVEFFVSDEANRFFEDPLFKVFPNPVRANHPLRITPRLSQRATLTLLVAGVGRGIIQRAIVKDILNQTFSINAPSKQGVYFIIIGFEGQKHNLRFLVI